MKNKQQNKLALEKSPYLLQHASNPVNWYPWGKEAFDRALAEDKPVFLSIGYSTCHWCHVMAHESFEDPEVARLMNEAFVSVKVDREERPDIDHLYMTVCQMMTGSAGWPLTIIMAPDKRPFYAATYLPKQSRFGRPGMLELVPYIKKIWHDRKSEVLGIAANIETELKKNFTQTSRNELDKTTLKRAYQQLIGVFDEEHGGFGNAPKFPTPHTLSFLLRYSRRNNEPKALQMVEKTLNSMRSGGIYDHVGFGFHRYSTDPYWLLPHFEKMLYDQALLVIACIEAYQVTRNEEYADTTREVLEYVLRDMVSPQGGFYSAEDADSEGEEGKFYLWTFDELRNILSEEEMDLAVKHFNIEEKGNYIDPITQRKSGHNILYTRQLPGKTNKRLDTIKQKLFNKRLKRIHPLKDDKILADWNGAMVAALARAGAVLHEKRYIEAAEGAINFIFRFMRDQNGRLRHSYRGGKAGPQDFIDDYAFLIWGLLELYEATFNVDYLKKALQLNDTTFKYFWDEENGGFFFTASDSEMMISRQKESYDGAMPSGNSVSMLNLLRLGRITFNSDLEKKAATIGRVFSSNITQSPAAYTQLLIALDFALGPTYEVVIAADSESRSTKAALSKLQSAFIPNKVIILRPTEVEYPDIAKISPVNAYKASEDGRANIFVCTDYHCQAPTTNINHVLKNMGVNDLTAL